MCKIFSLQKVWQISSCRRKTFHFVKVTGKSVGMRKYFLRMRIYQKLDCSPPGSTNRLRDENKSSNKSTKSISIVITALSQILLQPALSALCHKLWSLGHFKANVKLHCSSHHQIVIYICFWFWFTIRQIHQNYQQIVRRQCCLNLHICKTNSDSGHPLSSYLYLICQPYLTLALNWILGQWITKTTLIGPSNGHIKERKLE